MERAASGQEESASPKKATVMLTAIVALVLGGAAGAFGVGPMLGPAAPAGEKEAAAEGGGHGPEGEAAKSAIFSLEGIVVNPAGSRGQHHLIATVAFDVSAATDEPRLRAAEIPLRDQVSALLEQKTLDVLTSPGIRDQLRSELRALAEPLIKDGTVTVYLPQFIVQ